MHIAGIVCEYNPFHNGHAYHIAQTRNAGASHIVCVMSGNFVQRGEPAIINKFARAAAAVNCGADLVVEIPLPWSCACAQTFAQGAVFILKKLGAQMISFGSECGDISLIKDCSFAVDDEKIGEKVRTLVGEMSYPSAVRKSVSLVYGEKTAQILDKPNDTLNTEYLRAAVKFDYNPDFFAVKRQNLHDTDKMSAKSVRELIRSGEPLTGFVPEPCQSIILSQIASGFAPCGFEQIERAILMKLRSMSAQEIKQAPDITQGLENRIFRCARNAATLDELFNTVKTKRYTMAKIRRAVLSCFLGITEEDVSGLPPYIRVLAANDKGREILSAAAKQSELPILTKYSEAKDFSGKSKRIYSLECSATDIYALCSPNVRPCGTEMSDKAFFI